MNFRSLLLPARRTLLPLLLIAAGAAHGATTLLNVSYDGTREFYKDYNAAFAKHWKGTTGEAVTLNQSHGGSTPNPKTSGNGQLVAAIKR